VRLPWLQADQEGLARCRLLARLLGVPETQGIGIGMALWQWALECAPDGDFSGNVPDSALMSAAVGWAVDDAARLVTELQRVGLVATTPQLRVRGLERYRRAWEKNRRSPRKSVKSVDAVPEPGANPPGSAPKPARQTQTQTQTYTEASLPAVVEITPRPRVSDPPGGPPPPPPKPDSPLASPESFFAWVQHERVSFGYVTEKPPHPRKLSTWWNEVGLELSGDFARVRAAFEGYAKDAFWRGKQPPSPFEGFMAQWRKYAPARRVS